MKGNSSCTMYSKILFEIFIEKINCTLDVIRKFVLLHLMLYVEKDPLHKTKLVKTNVFYITQSPTALVEMPSKNWVELKGKKWPSNQPSADLL